MWLPLRCRHAIHNSTYVMCVNVDRQLDADLQDDFLDKIGREFGVDRTEASDIFGLLMNCMDYRLSVSRGMCVFCE